MCGIAGILGPGAERYRIEPMLQSIKHRGPDGTGIWKKAMAQLGHVRLSIIDLTHNSDQPMIDPSTGNILVFNGEIYNYLELRNELRTKYNFITDSDTEVILACYSVYGEACLSHFRGMFAFALYDATKNQTFIARDRIGIKPFYYRQYKNVFLFASEIKALIHLPSESETINQVKLFEFIANRQLDTSADTFFNEVKQLPPGSFCWITSEGRMREIHSYWDFPEFGGRKWTSESREEFVNLFNETIKLHLRADVQVGCFVSGGLDSSSVACFAEKNLITPLRTYSGILPYFHSENSLIKHITEAGKNIVPNYFELNGKSFFDDLPRVIFYHDEPILDGSMFSHYKLCEMAGKDGTKVLLSGAGGDELFGGYQSHLYSYLGSLLQQFKYGRYIKMLSQISKNSMYSRRDLFAKSFFELVPIRARRYLKNTQLKRRTPFLEIAPQIPHFSNEHTDSYYRNWVNNYRSWTAPPYLHYEDRNSMAFGIEIRVPFFDHILVEYIAQYDTSEIINGASKSIIRNNFRGTVPDPILEQKNKYGFPSPIDHALRNDMKGRELFFDNIMDVPFLNKQAVQKLGNSFYKGNGDLTLFFRTLSYMLWYRNYSNTPELDMQRNGE